MSVVRLGEPLLHPLNWVLIVLLIAVDATAADQSASRAASTSKTKSAPAQLAWTSPYRLTPHVLLADLQSTAMSLQIMLATPAVHAPPLGTVDRRDVNAIDRSVIGNDSETASSWSDLTRNASLVFPHLASTLDLVIDGDTERFARNSTLLWETLSVTSMLTNTVKRAVRRPRPYVYDQSTDPRTRKANNATLSFFSGHTSSAFSMATAYSYLYTLDHPGSPLIAPLWLGTHGLAAATAVLRGVAGKHFWTDVLAGAAAGSTVGIAVPALHQARRNNAFLADIRLMPLFYEGGFGSGVCGVW